MNGIDSRIAVTGGMCYMNKKISATDGGMEGTMSLADEIKVARKTVVTEGYDTSLGGVLNLYRLKIDDLAPNADVRVENLHENGQVRGNTKLLGKYRVQ